MEQALVAWTNQVEEVIESRWRLWHYEKQEKDNNEIEALAAVEMLA